MMIQPTPIVSRAKSKWYKKKVEKFALNSQLLTVQIWTNIVQVLILCLSYFITTACSQQFDAETLKIYFSLYGFYPLLPFCKMSQNDQYCYDLFKSGFKSSRFNFGSNTGILPNTCYILKDIRTYFYQFLIDRLEFLINFLHTQWPIVK